jgi:ABC transporter substrate binding protein (PQQ-dependent alcohol dehydrogenase system)
MRWQQFMSWLWLGTGSLAALAAPTPAKFSPQIAVISVADDPRYAARRTDKRFPGQSTGRLLTAARLGLDDAQIELQAAAVQPQLREEQAADSGKLGAMLEQLHKTQQAYWLLDLPDSLLPQALQAALKAGALVINASSAQDSLRAQSCQLLALHTYPSQAMLADALAQYLAARSWRQVLLLQGSSPADASLVQAWQRASKRYGLKTTDSRTFKLSGDPRERDAANTKLLTADRSHDVVAVWDSDGEFARGVPYSTQWPRPVLGSNGLTALAWHPQWERFGGPQLNRRFSKLAQRPMTGQDWAAWVGIKALVTAWVADPKASPVQVAERLRSGQIQVDGFKGLPLSFRAWDGQLRQPVLLGHTDGVVGVAPMDGVLHPLDTLDTLGQDEKESPCKKS